MQIKEFAAACGLSAHTLRYYEKMGLLPHVERTDSNHRRYSEQDIQWITFIKRLKATNMPLTEIQRYATLREQGPGTEAQRMQLLVDHARRLEQVIAQEQEHLHNLHQKIRFYRDQLCG
ncbi:MAG: MerR family transcriptional regulator [Desulfobulbus sp.]|nr:MerR family transcriptional regulator [Desulfobulbus sp.]